MQLHYTKLLRSLDIHVSSGMQNARSIFAQQYTQRMFSVPIHGLKLNPHAELDATFKHRSECVPDLTHIKQYEQGSSVFGVLTAFNQVYISHKDDLPLRNLSERDWFETGITA
jgi:hypothetical protein